MTFENLKVNNKLKCKLDPETDILYTAYVYKMNSDVIICHVLIDTARLLYFDRKTGKEVNSESQGCDYLNKIWTFL